MELRKKQYIAPVIELIRLDNQISLALESDAPIGPDETFYKVPEYFRSEPFKTVV